MESSATSSNVALTNARQEGSNRRSTKCCTKFVSILCSNLGVCLLVLVYTGLGAVLFTSLEGHNMSHHRSLPVKHSPDSPSGDSSDTQVGDAASNPSLGDTAPKSETLRKTSPESGEPTDKTAAAAAVIGSGEFDTQLLRHQTVERLWSITESLNILYRENWTRVVEKELRRYSEELLTSLIRQHNLADEAAASRKRHEDDAQEEFKEQWTFAGSFLYSLTVITTIGYGAVAPQTAVGRVATIVYALMGIPLMLLYLSSVGDLLSRGLKYIWGRLCRCRTPKPGPKLAPPPPPLSLSPPYSHSHNFKNGGCPPDCNNPDHAPIPVTFCMVIMVIYICGGAAIFSRSQGWSYLDALYFCFGSLTTIGFGDLMPSRNPQDTADAQLRLIGVSFYLLIGMALIATCFNLMQEQVTSRGSNSVVTRKLSGLVTTQTPHHRFHLDDT